MLVPRETPLWKKWCFMLSLWVLTLRYCIGLASGDNQSCCGCFLDQHLRDLTRIRCAFVYSVKHHLHFFFFNFSPFWAKVLCLADCIQGFRLRMNVFWCFLIDIWLTIYCAVLFIDLWFSQILSFAHVILCRQWRLLDGTTLQHQTGMSFESQMVEVYWGSYPLPTSSSLLLWLCTCQILLWASDSSCKCPVVEGLY